jgi:hypothetical protein
MYGTFVQVKRFCETRCSLKKEWRDQALADSRHSHEGGNPVPAPVGQLLDSRLRGNDSFLRRLNHVSVKNGCS